MEMGVVKGRNEVYWLLRTEVFRFDLAIFPGKLGSRPELLGA